MKLSTFNNRIFSFHRFSYLKPLPGLLSQPQYFQQTVFVPYKHLQTSSQCISFLSLPTIHTTSRRLLSSQHHLKTQNIPSKSSCCQRYTYTSSSKSLDRPMYYTSAHRSQRSGLPLTTSLCSQCLSPSALCNHISSRPTPQSCISINSTQGS
jgi:hypothetical protein